MPSGPSANDSVAGAGWLNKRGVQDPDAIRFRFPDPDAVKKSMLIQLDHVSFKYPAGPLLLDDVSVQVDITSRIGILGANGTGSGTAIWPPACGRGLTPLSLSLSAARVPSSACCSR